MRSYSRWIWLAGLLLSPAGLLAGQPASHNQHMADKIASVLQSNGDFTGSRIMIEYSEGIATLKGTVNTPWQRYEALQLAEAVRGVKRVVDGLAVVAAPEATLADMAPRAPVQPVSQPAPAAQQTVRQRPVPQQVQPARGWYLQEEAPQPMQAGALAAAPGYAAPAPAPVRYDLPHFPPYAWPSYASYPNYASLTYPQQYSPTAWPYIGPFYPYPQVPLGWRKVTLEWDDGWWFLEFDD